MANRCDLTGKRSQAGNNVPHSKHKTRRRFKPNLQTKRITAGGQTFRLKVSTSGLKSLFGAKKRRTRAAKAAQV